MAQDTLEKFKHAAEDKARSNRILQETADTLNPRQKPETPPLQAGARVYPVPPFSSAHLTKPGHETDVTPAPLYDAPYYKGSEKLSGKVALITGGDSEIGRAVAVLFAREGADVSIIYLDEHEDAEITQRAVEAEGRQALTFSGDVSDPRFCQYAVDQTLAKLGRVDVLVNNAAFQQHVFKLEDLSVEQFDRTLTTNLRGYFNMVKACVPHMKPGSAIINTGSVTGLQGAAELLDYSTTKGGIHSFTRSLSGQVIGQGIRVNCVAPGPVWTPLNPADREGEGLEQFGAKTTMKRPAQPEEIAPAYVFLAAPSCSSFITGEILPIIGGY